MAAIQTTTISPEVENVESKQKEASMKYEVRNASVCMSDARMCVCARITSNNFNNKEK